VDHIISLTISTTIYTTKNHTNPNIIAFHNIMLFSAGEALTPGGGSSCSL